MPFTVTITKTTNGLESAYSETDSYIAGAKEAVSEIIASGVNNQLLNYTFVANSGKIFAVSTSAEYNVTVKTNSTSSPDNIFIVNNTSPVIFNAITGSNGSIVSWGNYDAAGNTLEDINSLYITNTGLSECSIFVDALFDPTP